MERALRALQAEAIILRRRLERLGGLAGAATQQAQAIAEDLEQLEGRIADHEASHRLDCHGSADGGCSGLRGASAWC